MKLKRKFTAPGGNLTAVVYPIDQCSQTMVSGPLVARVRSPGGP
jgi:hypothetical protein